jgi:hypothetical protein
MRVEPRSVRAEPRDLQRCEFGGPYFGSRVLSWVSGMWEWRRLAGSYLLCGLCVGGSDGGVGGVGEVLCNWLGMYDGISVMGDFGPSLRPIYERIFQ